MPSRRMAGESVFSSMRQISITGLVFLWSVAFAQPPESKPGFEAASIKPAAASPTQSSTLNTDPGRVTATNWPLRFYIMWAYGVKTDSQIVGGPSWIAFDRYDIVATLATADPSKSKQENDDRIRLAFQTLLEDRFHVVVHRESKPGTGYALTVAKNGPSLKESTPGIGNSNRWRGGLFTANNTTMTIFASQLTGILGSPVEDKTGIPGEFDITLEFSPEGQSSSDKPVLSVALQEQLGLKLTPQKITQEILVIDRAEKPSAN